MSRAKGFAVVGIAVLLLIGGGVVGWKHLHPHGTEVALNLTANPVGKEPVGAYARTGDPAEPPARRASAAHLRQIGVAARMYANASKAGDLPPDFWTMFDTQDISMNDFINPRRRPGLPGEVKQMTRKQLKPWLEQNSDYDWLGAGLDNTTSQDTIIAAEKPEGLVDGLNVLFVDGHVEFFAMAEATQRISTAKERIRTAKTTKQDSPATAPSPSH